MTDLAPPAAPTPAPTPAPAPRRWTRWLLIASLGFNLVIVGLAVGHELSRAVYGPRPPVRYFAFGPFTEALSPDDRHALIRAFFQQEKGFASQRAEMRADFARLIGALKAEPYDPAVMADVLQRQKARNDAWLAVGQKLLSDRLAAMTPAERAAFADRLQADMARHDHRPPGPKGN